MIQTQPKGKNVRHKCKFEIKLLHYSQKVLDIGLVGEVYGKQYCIVGQ